MGPPGSLRIPGPGRRGGGAAAAGGSSSDAERPPIGYQEQVRFRWTISAPDVPSGVAHEGDVAMRAHHVFSREGGVPVPAAWGPAPKFGAHVQQALAKAHEEVPDYVCRVYDLYRGTPAAPAAATATTARTPGPRTGEKWVFREPNGGRAEVWVAAHHAADTWWCVKAPVPVWRRMAATCGAKSI